MEFHGQLVEMQEACALLRKQMWVWWEVSENSRADGDNK